MKIAIIGTGGIGAGLASVLAKTAHDITVSDRKGGTEAAAMLAAKGVSVRAAEVRPAVQAADVVILAVPYGAAAGLAQPAFAAWSRGISAAFRPNGWQPSRTHPVGKAQK